MPARPLPVHRISMHAALFLGLMAVFAFASHAQDVGAPRIGGNSTFDSAPGASGNDGSPARRRLSALTAAPEDLSSLRLSPGFLLSIDVYDTPELSSDLRIDADGDIAMPTVGRIHVTDRTLTQAADAIARRLRDGKILNNPQVTVNIAQYTGSSVTVLGEVHNPGRIELLAPHSLADILAQAGGETQFAGKSIEIRHQPGGAIPQLQIVTYSAYKNSSPAEADVTVFPGDTVTVQRAGVVYILGAVNRPGGYLMQEAGDLNVSQALSLAYGTSMGAAISSMRLIRKLPDGRVEETPIPFRDIINGKIAPPPLHAEDVIYVPVSKLKTVLSTSLLATTAQAAIYVH